MARRGSGGLVSGMQQVIHDAGGAPNARPRAAGGLAAELAGGGSVDDAAVAVAESSEADPPSGIVWVCAALSEADRRATRLSPDGRLDRAGFDTGGAAVRMLDVDRVLFDRAYNGVANRTLWFVLHLLFAPASEPSFGATFWRDWEAYEAYNAMFADALATEAATGAAVLIQDYHLTLVPGLLRKQRPDLRISHFTHTPWAPPDYFQILPDRVSRAVIGGMLGADRLGFLTARWATAFRDCARALLGDEVLIGEAPADETLADGARLEDAGRTLRVERASVPVQVTSNGSARGGQAAPGGQQGVDDRAGASTALLEPAAAADAPAGHEAGPDGDLAVEHGGHLVRIGVHPLGVDAAALRTRAAATDVTSRAAELRELVGDRRLIVRIDRTELSKNIVRGLDAYRELLRTHPEWRGRVTHLVCAYPSRHDLPEYREYTAAVQRIATEIEDEFAIDDWLPLRLEVTDDYPRSLAALTLADVLVVNPIRDGMNLIAKEGPAVSDRDVALVLSREAGAYAELGTDALVINPYDVTATAEAMDAALRMPIDERRRRAGRLAALAARLPPGDWFRQQLDLLPAPTATP
ncbi:alpha,alpha-trehalose-phosphate synthase (UDP-forming) [Frankia nepalensis]|nr:trehalose-6-phosphate synthase [Frankia nepalensis]